MPIHYSLQQNKIKSNKAYGKWYAHPIKQGELTMAEIEEQIEQSCSLKKSDVRAVISALKEAVERGLKDGMVVNLDELGKYYLSIKSACVDKPEDFRVDKHVKEIICKYTPEGHRSKSGNKRIVRSFTNNCELVEQTHYDSNTGERKRARRGGTFRKG